MTDNARSNNICILESNINSGPRGFLKQSIRRQSSAVLSDLIEMVN